MLISALISFLNLIIKAIGSVCSSLLSLLPKSPFTSLQGISIPLLNTLNWVFPIQFMINVTGLWLSAILLYYVVQIVLRWVKMIE